MHTNQIKSFLRSKLEQDFTPDEINAFGFWVIPHVHTLIESLPISINENEDIQVLRSEVISELQTICDQLLKRIPIQYIFEAAFFGPLTLKVSPATLIPRPETEELCEHICKQAKSIEARNGSAIKLLDIGTGSGCIPLYLLHHNPKWVASAVDISEDALDIAAENAFHTGVQERLQLLHLDILSEPGDSEKLELCDIDLLISNPPYIQQSEANSMHENVLNHEPHIALFTPEVNSLIFYQKLASLAKENLQHRSKPLHIWLEINQYLWEETLMLFSEFAEAEVLCDLSNNPRFIRAIALT
jgi:release factor glutamine methyltransferase